MSPPHRISALCLAFCLLLASCGGAAVDSNAGNNGNSGNSGNPIGSTTPLKVAVVPVITPPGGAFSSTQSVTIADATPGANIYYTTDGSTPTASSSLYAAAITVSATTNLKAIAIATGYADSSIATASFSITPAPVLTAAPSPIIAPDGGTLTGSQTVTLSDGDSSAAIHYTLDGSTPTSASSLYSGPLTIGSNTTLNAIATAAGETPSPLSTATFTIILAPLPTPVITPASASFYGTQTISIADAATGASIYYTLDGSTPNTASLHYGGGITLPAGTSTTTTTVKAIAIAAGAANSVVASATFTINPAVSNSPTYSFKNVQIVGGGFVTGLFFHPTQQGLMYARTDVGGAYRWSSSGGDTRWVPLTDFIGRFNNGNDAGTESLAVDPSDPTKLYLAMGEYSESYGTNGAIFASSDQGNTFTSSVQLPIKMGSNDTGRGTGERLMVDPLNGHHLYFGSRNNGLYESTDQAASWHAVSAFPVSGVNTLDAEDPEIGVIFEQFVAANGVAPNGNAATVYVGVSSSGTGTYMPLYVSSNGGVSFAPVPGQPTGYWPNKESLDAVNGILYVTYGRYNATPACISPCYNTGPTYVNAGQVWKYVLPTGANAAGTWSNITPPQTTPTGNGEYGYGSVAVDPQHANVVMVTTMNKYYPPPYDDIFRSLDAGVTWVNVGTNATRNTSLAPWVNFGAATAGPGNWLNHLSIDPFNSDHVMYGTGQTVWATQDMTAADGVTTNTVTANHANATAWVIGALGIEEVVVNALISPPSGPASLLSAVDDLGGFTHIDLGASPAAGAWRTSGAGIDFAQNQPLNIVRIGSVGGNGASTLASYSTDGGNTWVAFANNPAGVVKGLGTLAISASAASILWQPSDPGVSVAYSTNNGTTWSASSGLPSQVSTGGLLKVLADRINPQKFYVFNPNTSGGGSPVYVSTDAGQTFTSAGTPTTSGSALIASPADEGDLWEISSNGLYHSTNSGATFAALGNVKVSYGVGFGMPAPGYTYPTIFMIGQTTADAAAANAPCTANTAQGFTIISNCIYRSVDGGASFVRINDFAHQWSRSSVITGDPRVFGRFYLGTPGRGIIQGDSPN